MSTRFTGRLVMADDPQFLESVFTRVHNGRHPDDRLPAAVLHAENVEDVRQGVLWAKENGLTVAVRAGGHSWIVWSVHNGSLLIDLKKLNNKGIDAATGIAWAEPAVMGGAELAPFLKENGRFFHGGHCPEVAVGGFLLQGGQGWLQRGHGWGCEWVTAIDMITADGELIHCDETQNQDLFWAARGAGPSFPGIVTKFYLETRPLYGYCGHSMQVYPLELFDEVMAWLYEIDQVLDKDVEVLCMSAAPPLPDGSPGPRVFIVNGFTLTDSKERGDEVLAPLQTSPVIDLALVNEPNMQKELADLINEANVMYPTGARHVVNDIWVDGDPAEVIRRIKPLFVDLTEPHAHTIWIANGPMRPLKDMAFSMQAPGYVATYIIYDDPARDAENLAFVQQALAFAEPVTVGQYLGDSDLTNKQMKFMADDNFAKLQGIIADRDPEGSFVRYLTKDPSTINRNEWE